MADEPSRAEVMTRRFELADAVDRANAAHKAALAPLIEEQTLCENYIKQTMIAGGEQQTKTDAGMAYWTTKTSCKVSDFDAVIATILADVPEPPWLGQGCAWAQVLDHVRAHGMWGLLTRAVSKDAVKELLDEGTPVAGVEFSTYKDLAWRRG